jgi:hypothetical protein
VGNNKCRIRPRAETQVRRTAQCSMTVVKDSPVQVTRVLDGPVRNDSCQGRPRYDITGAADRPVGYDRFQEELSAA